MASIFLALAASATLAAPDVDHMFELSDYPYAAMAAGKSGAAIVEMMVDPGGRVVTCETKVMIGDEKLAARLCPMLLRKHLTGARLATGERAYGWVRALPKFFLPDTPDGNLVQRAQLAPDFTLTLATLPGGAKALRGTTTLAVDSGGSATDCRDTPEPREDPLHSAVCRWLLKQPQAVRRDPSGTAVPYVTQLVIEVASGS